MTTDQKVKEPEAKLQIVSKFGEVTNKKMYQVRGDPHWHSSPTIALEVHNRVKAHIAAGGFKSNRKK